MITISISLTEQTLTNIDDKKGLVSRSKFIEHLVGLGLKFQNEDKKLS